MTEGFSTGPAASLLATAWRSGIALILARDILPGDVPIAPEDTFSEVRAAFDIDIGL